MASERWRSKLTWFQAGGSRQDFPLHYHDDGNPPGVQWDANVERDEWGGVSICGVNSKMWHAPGFPSRMGADRCKKCCRKLGIPPGVGVPGNGWKGTQDENGF